LKTWRRGYINSIYMNHVIASKNIYRTSKVIQAYLNLGLSKIYHY
jgi:hypothetical protein